MADKITESEEGQRRQKARIGYQTAIELVSLTSHEIYSRFNAMLTANSIIIAIIGWGIISGDNFPRFLIMFLPIMGMLLCILWGLFVHHGVHWQDQFRKEAIRLEEEYYIDTFKLISLVKTEIPRSSKTRSETPRLVRWFNFYHTSIIVIGVFMTIYIVMLLSQIIWIPSPISDP
jgi:hypothetical protein